MVYLSSKFVMYITDIKVNDGRNSAVFQFYEIDIFWAHIPDWNRGISNVKQF